MKITDVTAYPVQHERAPYLVVVVDTDEGICGLGESTLSGRDEAVAAAVRHLAELVRGEDPLRTEHLWQLMWRGGFFPAEGIGAAAVAAIDIALWDIKGKALGQPVYNLLGGRVRDRVDCYVHTGVQDHLDIDETVAQAQVRVAEGWRYLRYVLLEDRGVLEPAVAARQTAAMLTAVRDAVGEDVELLVDVHTRIGLPEAVWFAREVAPLRMYFIEDPMRSEYLDGYQALRAQAPVPLAAGEQLSSKWQFRGLIEHNLIDYARIDLCIAGGLTEAVKIAALCETHDVRVVTHNPMGLISTAACLHLNLALTPFGVQEQPFVPGTFDRTLFPVQQGEFSNGSLTATDTPGLGVEFDREAAKAHPAARNAKRTLRRADGSFTNW